VQAALEIVKQQRMARVNMTADSVLSEMAALAHSDITHYTVDDDGRVQLVEGAPANAMSAIQSIKHKKTIKEDDKGNVTITHDVEIKLWDKPAPLKLMGKHVGLFPDRMEHTGKDGKPIETVSRIERVVVKPKQDAA
jgi:phage terminase small subunit